MGPDSIQEEPIVISDSNDEDDMIVISDSSDDEDFYDLTVKNEDLRTKEEDEEEEIIFDLKDEDLDSTVKNEDIKPQASTMQINNTSRIDSAESSSSSRYVPQSIQQRDHNYNRPNTTPAYHNNADGFNPTDRSNFNASYTPPSTNNNQSPQQNLNNSRPPQQNTNRKKNKARARRGNQARKTQPKRKRRCRPKNRPQNNGVKKEGKAQTIKQEPSRVKQEPRVKQGPARVKQEPRVKKEPSHPRIKLESH